MKSFICEKRCVDFWGPARENEAMLKAALNMLGMTSATIAQKLSDYGDPVEIQRAIDSGDTRALSFIPKLAAKIRNENPEMFNRVQSMFSGRR